MRTGASSSLKAVSQTAFLWQAYVKVALDKQAIAALQLEVKAHTVATAIVRNRKLKLKAVNVAYVIAAHKQLLPPCLLLT